MNRKELARRAIEAVIWSMPAVNYPYLDENLSAHVAEILRGRGLHVVSAHEVGNTQLDDRTQLRYATMERQAIVTCDLADFTELAGEFIAANIEHAGTVLIPSTFSTDEFAAIAGALEQVAHAHSEVSGVCPLPETRVALNGRAMDGTAWFTASTCAGLLHNTFGARWPKESLLS
jgi:hypothetical protein